MAGSYDRGRLAVDQAAKRIAVAGQDGLDNPKRLIVARRFGASVATGVAVEGDG